MSQCLGMVACKKKDCIEQDRCYFEWVRKTVQRAIAVRELSVAGKPVKKVREPIVKPCQVACIHKEPCEILGQCIFDHPLVANSRQAFAGLCNGTAVIGVIQRLMPDLRGMTERNYWKNKRAKLKKKHPYRRRKKKSL